jgi:hypothetical protein
MKIMLTPLTKVTLIFLDAISSQRKDLKLNCSMLFERAILTSGAKFFLAIGLGILLIYW